VLADTPGIKRSEKLPELRDGVRRHICATIDAC
jgi:hypothetical protein